MILIAPHNDDEALFASYIIQRTKPWVIICMDGNQHERKFNLPVEERRQESRNALKILGASHTTFLRISDEMPSVDKIANKLLRSLGRDCGESPGLTVFAPRKTGGNAQHDMVSDAATQIFQDVIYYGTYSKDNLAPTGEMEIIPTSEEREIKEQALACYPSQIRINGHHFEAVKGKSEFLSFKQ